MFLQYFHTVGWVIWPVKTVSRITYTVLADVKHCSINQSINQCRLAVLGLRRANPGVSITIITIIGHIIGHFGDEM